MDAEQRTLLERKLEAARRQRCADGIAEQKERLRSIGGFDAAYRFAADSEAERLHRFIGRLDFSAPAQLRVQVCSSTPHDRMYLCFLCGTAELLNIFLYGAYDDFLRNLDDFQMFSPYLLLIDADFIRYVYINDAGEIKESRIF